MSKNTKLPATKSEIEEIINKNNVGLSEVILNGVQIMFDEQNKLNDTKFATKDDLKTLATKEDLKRETSFIRQDISDLRAEIATSPTRKEFNKFKSKFATS